MSNTFYYSKLLWVKILVAVFGFACCVELTFKAWESHIDVEMLSPEEYSTDVEIVAYSLLSVWFINYLIVCLQRLNDFIGTDGGFLEINLHRNVLFPFSRKYAKGDLQKIQGYDIGRLHFLIFIPYGIRLKLKIDDKFQTFIFVSLKANTKELGEMLQRNGVPDITVLPLSVRYADWSVWETVFVIVLFAISGGTALGMEDRMFFPSLVMIPIYVWGMLMGFRLRDIFHKGVDQSIFTGIAFGGVMLAAIVLGNYNFADWDEPDVLVMHKIRNSWSKFEPERGTGRNKKPARTCYNVSFKTIGQNEDVKVVSISKEQYNRAKNASFVVLPMHRGAFGYPVYDKDKLEFRNKIKPRYRFGRALRRCEYK